MNQLGHHRFTLLNDGDHAVIPMNGHRICVDTGSPFTFRPPGGPDTIQILDWEVDLSDIPVPAGRMEEGARLMDFHFDVLLGMDLMGPLIWRLDWEEGRAEAAPTLDEEPGTTWVGLSPILSLPESCPSCRVQGGREVALFDTGARLSYVVGDPPASARRVGETRDFNPQLGIFTTPVWEDTLEIGGHEIPVRFGQVPQPALTLFQAMGARWILGSDLLKAFRVTLDFPGRRLGLKPHTGGH